MALTSPREQSDAAKLAAINPATAPAQSCPVAALAAEAAQIVRAIYAATDSKARQYLPAAAVEMPDLGYLFDVEAGPTPEKVRQKLRDRVESIAQFAQFRRATSLKGALFQLYLIGREVICLDADIKLDTHESMQLRKIGDRCEDLLYSALQPLETDDDDLRLLRVWFYPTENEEAIRGEVVLSELAKRAPG
jgi:hypothetical protein